MRIISIFVLAMAIENTPAQERAATSPTVDLFQKAADEAHVAAMRYLQKKGGNPLRGFPENNLFENAVDLQLIRNDSKKVKELYQLVHPNQTAKELNSALEVRELYALGRSSGKFATSSNDSRTIGEMRALVYALGSVGQESQALSLVKNHSQTLGDAESQIQLFNDLAEALAGKGHSIPKELSDQLLSFSRKLQNAQKARQIVTHLRLAKFFDKQSTAGEMIAEVMPIAEELLDTDPRKIMASVDQLHSLIHACVDAKNLSGAKKSLELAWAGVKHPNYSKLGREFLGIILKSAEVRVGWADGKKEQAAKDMEKVVSSVESLLFAVEADRKAVLPFEIQTWVNSQAVSSLIPYYRLSKMMNLQEKILPRLKTMARNDYDDKFFYDLGLSFHVDMDNKRFESHMVELIATAADSNSPEQKFARLRTVAAIFHKSGKTQERNRIIDQVLGEEAIVSSRKVPYALALDLIEFDQFKLAYDAIGKIDKEPDKTHALSKLALEMGKSRVAPPMRN